MTLDQPRQQSSPLTPGGSDHPTALAVQRSPRRRFRSVRARSCGVSLGGLFVAIAVISVGAIGAGFATPTAASPISDVFEFSIEHVRIDSLDGFDVIAYSGAELDVDASQIGHPQLPIQVFHYALPAGTRLSNISIEVLQADTLKGEYLPLPIQPLDPEDEPAPPDSAIYESDTPYPVDVAFVGADGHMQGYHLGAVGIYPLRYVGASRSLILATEVQLTLTLAPLDAAQLAMIHHRNRPDPVRSVNEPNCSGSCAPW